VEGLALRPGWESFVGAGPMPMRHGLTLGETAYIEAALGAFGNAAVAGGSGSALASATLNVAGCRITRTWRSNGTVSDTPNCGLADSFAVGTASGVAVSVAIPYALLGPSPLGNYVTLSAGVRAEVASLFAPATALTSIGGMLGVATSATDDASFGFANPDTLTVPEPGASSIGLAAVAARRTRRTRRGSGPSGAR
jgi:hypothetical protein